MEEEIWKPVVGYESRYIVSSYGRIMSLDVQVPTKGSSMRTHKGKELKWLINIEGYASVRLYDGKSRKGKHWFVHKIVAYAFLEKPNYDCEINHKDENPLNNHVSNLEWCTHKYNVRYGSRTERITRTRTEHERVNAELPVRQYSRKGKFINEFKSISEAERQTGVPGSKICMVCHGLRNSAGGYGWRTACEKIAEIEEIHQRNKPVAQYLLDGTFVASFDSIREASRCTGIIRQCIIPAIKRCGTAGGYVWKYLD